VPAVTGRRITASWNSAQAQLASVEEPEDGQHAAARCPGPALLWATIFHHRVVVGSQPVTPRSAREST
jgi:hypothetical protein